MIRKPPQITLGLSVLIIFLFILYFTRKLPSNSPLSTRTSVESPTLHNRTLLWLAHKRSKQNRYKGRIGKTIPGVYTYYGAIPENLHLKAFAKRALQLWLRNWYQHGFHPQILTSEYALAHPNFTALNRSFSHLPTVNNLQYELTCYHRWLALFMAGGGTLMDYDILTLGKVEFPSSVPVNQVWSYPILAPMLTHAGLDGLNRQIQFMANYHGPMSTVNGHPHISDMQIMRTHLEFYSKLITPTPPIIHVSSQQYVHFRQTVNNSSSISREDLSQNLLVLSRLNRRKVGILMPPKVKLLVDPNALGLGLPNQTVTYLLQYLQDPVTFPSLEGPNRVLQSDSNQTTTKANFSSVWPQDFSEGKDLLFVIFESDIISSYNNETLQAITQYLPSDSVIPLLASDPMGIQLILGYQLGATPSVLPKFYWDEEDTPPGSETIFFRLLIRYYEVLEEVLEIERQLDFLK